MIRKEVESEQNITSFWQNSCY